MPETSNRTICAVSLPVTVITDEIMAELVQRLPREVCIEALRNALTRAQEQLAKGTARNRRSDAYKALKLIRHMANRLRPLPDDFAVQLGEKSATEVVTEGMTVDAEDFATLADDLPEFKQFASVFNSYPYLELKDVPGFGLLVVLGYCSGRGKTSNKLYRRNCILAMPDGKRINFKDIGSAIGVLQETGPDGTHYTIKAIPYANGMGVKFWTNLIGERDVPDQYRYLFLYSGFKGPSHLFQPIVRKMTSEAKWETLQHEHRMIKQQEAERNATAADIAPAPLKP